MGYGYGSGFGTGAFSCLDIGIKLQIEHSAFFVIYFSFILISIFPILGALMPFIHHIIFPKHQINREYDQPVTRNAKIVQSTFIFAEKGGVY